ncbi:DNA sulfur modification protein DndB [Paenibacillus sp. NPDC058174]|uniref:DNA sulfur modification protein DndB n=1 Tax=Paenibacillus sp. NPDC058174 TaxID=3346366 RepID=UPI0036D84C2D
MAVGIKSADDLYVILLDTLTEIAKHRDQQRAIEDFLAENHKMPRGTFLELVAQPDKVSNFEREELAAIINAVFAITQNDDINPEHFLKSKEIKDLNQFEFERPFEYRFPFTFAPTIRVTDEDYLTAVSFKQLAALEVNGLLTYNFDTQRLAKKSVSKRTGEVKKKKNIKNASVNNIVKLMKEGVYNPSTLLFNVLVDGKSSISYSDGELTINEGSTLNIIDGAHRLEAIVRIIEEDPDFDGYMNIDIKHYPLEKAQHLLATTNTVNPFDKTLVKYYGGNEYGQEITKYLMTLPVLRDRIEIKTALSKGISITNFAIISEAIQSIFDPKDTKDKYDVQDVMKKMYEYLIPSFQDELIKNRVEHLKVSWFPHHNMHVGFVVIAKKLFDKYGKDYPVDKIIEIINRINFNKSDSPLTEIMSGQGKTNSDKVKVQIKNFVKSEVDKILE